MLDLQRRKEQRTRNNPHQRAGDDIYIPVLSRGEGQGEFANWPRPVLLNTNGEDVGGGPEEEKEEEQQQEEEVGEGWRRRERCGIETHLERKMLAEGRKVKPQEPWGDYRAHKRGEQQQVRVLFITPQ